MKALTPLLLCCLLPAAAQQAVDLTTATTAHFAGWGSFTIPLPDGYRMAGIRGAEGTYTFRIVQGSGEVTQAPKAEDTLMEICSSLNAPPTPAGSEITATVAGEQVTGIYTEGSGGKGGNTSFCIAKGVEGANLSITVADGPHRGVMLTMLEKLQAEEAPKTEAASPAAPDMSTAEPQSFRCHGTLILPVPPGVQVVQQDSVDSYLLHVYGTDKKQGMTLYSGYNPALGEEGGRTCTAAIAGETVQGRQHKDRQEYILERGAQGALLHIVVYKGEEEPLMLAMLQGMEIQAPPAMPEKAKAQVDAVFGATARLTAAVNELFAGVKDAKSAAAAVPKLQELLQEMKKTEAAGESLSKKYGRAASPHIGTITPATAEGSADEHIQRVHDADCYGCEELQELLEDFMGL